MDDQFYIIEKLTFQYIVFQQWQLINDCVPPLYSFLYFEGMAKGRVQKNLTTFNNCSRAMIKWIFYCIVLTLEAFPIEHVVSD